MHEEDATIRIDARCDERGCESKTVHAGFVWISGDCERVKIHDADDGVVCVEVPDPVLDGTK